MKKKAPVVFAIVLIAVLCVLAWLYGYSSRKSNDNIPSKELMVSYCQNKGTDYASEQLKGYTEAQLKQVWGKPDGSLFGMWGEIWETNTSYDLVVYYDHNGVAEHVMAINENS